MEEILSLSKIIYKSNTDRSMNFNRFSAQTFIWKAKCRDEWRKKCYSTRTIEKPIIFFSFYDNLPQRGDGSTQLVDHFGKISKVRITMEFYIDLWKENGLTKIGIEYCKQISLPNGLKTEVQTIQREKVIYCIEDTPSLAILSKLHFSN